MTDKGDIHKISQLLGDMNANIQHIRRQVDAVDNKVQHINDQGIRHEMKIESAHKRIDDIVPVVNSHQKIVDKGQGMIKLGALILSALGFIGGLIGSFIAKLLNGA